VTTQSPHLYARHRYARRGGPIPGTARGAASVSGAAAPSVSGAASGAGTAAGVQTRLPWWAIVLPAVAFAALLALLSAGPADASAAAPGADLLARLVADFRELIGHLL
jgi:hypothetical protein